MSVDITKTRRTNYDVSWNAQDIGGVDKVDLSKVAMLLDPVKIGSLGALKLDDRYVGLEDGAEVIVQAREISRVLLERMHPWFSGTSGATIELGPAPGVLIGNQYAQQLVLHPRDKGATTNEDITLYKTVPEQLINLSRDGKTDDVWEIHFKIYPDLTKVSTNPPTNPYGKIG